MRHQNNNDGEIVVNEYWTIVGASKKVVNDYWTIVGAKDRKRLLDGTQFAVVRRTNRSVS